MGWRFDRRVNSENWPPRTDECLPLADETGASTTDILRAHAVVSEVLQAAGAEVSRLSGCCGLAGNFAIEKSLTTTSPSPNNSSYL